MQHSPQCFFHIALPRILLPEIIRKTSRAHIEPNTVLLRRNHTKQSAVLFSLNIPCVFIIDFPMNQMNHLLFINHFHYVVFHYESAVAYGHDLRRISLPRRAQ